jgi:two-component system, cell cycle sensor histidine kinase and response regulator CckA
MSLATVEDEDIVRDLAREVLQYYGYMVITAENGEDGLRVCREFAGQIDLVLTDLVMPRMSGRELAEQLAVERPGMRVFYMSGFTDDAIVRHGLLEEDIAFIHKPFTPESLATKIMELLDNVN